MNEREKIEKIYQKNNIKVSKEYIDNIMKDKKRVKDFMRLYKQEKIDAMNYIIGKPIDNTTFTKFELEAMQKIDLFNRSIIKICKNIWNSKDNPKKMQQILELLKKQDKKEVIA